MALAEARCLGALHGDGHGDVTIAENLDRETATDSALGNQRVNGDLAALREQLPKSGDVDNLVFLLERALEATQLRQRMYSGSWPPSKPGRT